MRITKTLMAALLAIEALPIFAQRGTDDMEYITVNDKITTIITASEPVRFVDISTDMVAGDQPVNNTIRLKPKEGV